LKLLKTDSKEINSSNRVVTLINENWLTKKKNDIGYIRNDIVLYNKELYFVMMR